MIVELPAYCADCGLPEKGHPDPRQAVMYDHTPCYRVQMRRIAVRIGRAHARIQEMCILRDLLEDSTLRPTPAKRS